MPLRYPVQAKLRVGAVNDPLEREADRVAEQVMRVPSDQVMRMPDHELAVAAASAQLSRKCAAWEAEDKLQVKPAETAEAAGREAPAIVQQVLRSPGQPLDAATRAFFEPRFGHDFSQVRVHAGAKAAESARAVNALAYTAGPHVVFAAERHSPQTSAGRRLLVHELTHVVQQQGAPALRNSPVSGTIATRHSPHSQSKGRSKRRA